MELAQDFRSMVAERRADGWEVWLAKATARTARIKELPELCRRVEERRGSCASCLASGVEQWTSRRPSESAENHQTPDVWTRQF